MSCFSCVSSPSLAVLLSAVCDSLSCWDAAESGIPECHSGSALTWRRPRPARCHSTGQEQEKPRGLKSECGTEESGRTELWRRRAAAGCSSARVDHRPKLLRHKTPLSPELTNEKRLCPWGHSAAACTAAPSFHMTLMASHSQPRSFQTRLCGTDLSVCFKYSSGNFFWQFSIFIVTL